VGKKFRFNASIKKKTKKIFYTKVFCFDEKSLIIATGGAKCIKVD